MTMVPLFPVNSESNPGATEDVRALQYLLNCSGLSLKADGIYGPRTKDAVGDFQKSQGLIFDGVAGEQTWTRLTDGAAIHSTIRRGDQGDCVRAAQVELARHVDPSLQVDGIFGSLTENAVKQFQQGKTMVDGIVGLITWRWLVGSS